MSEEEDREVQFIATLGAMAHMRNQQIQTAELRKQNDLSQQRATAEAQRAKIEAKRLEIDLREKEIEAELKSAEKSIRKEMVSLDRRVEKLDQITSGPSDYVDNKNKLSFTREVGILMTQLGKIEDLDLLSDLNDLEFISKLNSKFQDVLNKLIQAGLSEEHPKIHLDYALDKNAELIARFEDAIIGCSFKTGSNCDYILHEKLTDENIALIAKQILEDGEKVINLLGQVSVQLNQDDLSRDNLTEEINFSKELYCYDVLKNDEDLQLQPSKRFLSFLVNPKHFIENFSEVINSKVRELSDLNLDLKELINQFDALWDSGNFSKLKDAYLSITNFAKANGIEVISAEKKYQSYVDAGLIYRKAVIKIKENHKRFSMNNNYIKSLKSGDIRSQISSLALLINDLKTHKNFPKIFAYFKLETAEKKIRQQIDSMETIYDLVKNKEEKKRRWLYLLRLISIILMSNFLTPVFMHGFGWLTDMQLVSSMVVILCASTALYWISKEIW